MKRIGIAALAIAFLFVVGCVRMAGLIVGPMNEAPETLYAKTSDGWNIALHHYPGTSSDRYPVLLCHGLGANRHNLDSLDKMSLARYLNKQGWDIWLIELRGVGMSDTPSVSNDLEWTDIDFEKFTDYDIPAAIKFIQESTGKEKIHWIGHSMGGMAVYGYVERHGGDALASMTVIASPIYFDWHHNDVFAMYKDIAPVTASLMDVQIQQGPAAIGAMLPRKLDMWPLYALGNPDNIEKELFNKVGANLVTDMPSKLFMQFALAIGEGPFKSSDGQFDYYQNLYNVKVPAYLLAGVEDILAPPGIVFETYTRIGSTDKKFGVIGKSDGHHADYGHGDLGIGPYFLDDVAPGILEWISSHDRKSQP